MQQIALCLLIALSTKKEIMEEIRVLDIGEHIDRLITTDVHTRKFIIDLYNAARRIQGDKPITYLAAKRILDELKGGETVLMLVGFPTFGTYIGEQDGPVGGAILARTIVELINDVKVIVLTDKAQANMVKRAYMGAGFSVAEKPNDIVHSHQVYVEGVNEGVPINPSPFLDNYSPKVIIAIERPGRNENGKYVSMKGLDLSTKIARVDELIIEGNKRGVLTIGIADGGNEIGCGVIRNQVIEYHPTGKAFASTVSTNILVFASASNLGAYGVAGMISAISKDIYILPSVDVVYRTLLASSLAGLHNGPPLWLDPGTDGIPYDIELFIWRTIQRMIWEETNPHFPKFYNPSSPTFR